MLSTLAGIIPSTFLLSLGHVTHVFQQMPAVPYTWHTVPPSGTLYVYSVFILLGTFFKLANTIHSFTPSGFSHQMPIIGMKFSNIFLFSPYDSIFYFLFSHFFYSANCISHLLSGAFAKRTFAKNKMYV